jgi:hypothetical protein
MTLYRAVLFLHVASALALASALGIDASLLFHLRRAVKPNDSRSWLHVWRAVPWLAGGSGLVLLLSGGYLTHQIAGWSLGWPEVALGALVLIGALGGVTNGRMRGLKHISGAEKTNESEYMKRLQDPVLKVSIGIRIALVLASVLLMTVTPDLPASLVIVGVSILLGFCSALPLSPRVVPSSLAGTIRNVRP